MSAAPARPARGAALARLRRRPPVALVALAAFALPAALWMAYEARAVTFWSDDWAFVVDRRGWDADALLWRVVSGADTSRAPADLWGGYIERGITRSVGALLGLRSNGASR